MKPGTNTIFGNVTMSYTKIKITKALQIETIRDDEKRLQINDKIVIKFQKLFVN